MISGKFNKKGELIFKVGLIAADGEIISVRALLDTGFDGWLIVNNQDAESLDWRFAKVQENVQTAAGKIPFKVYVGTVFLDADEYRIPVLGGDEIDDMILGVRWLRTKQLLADFPAGVLTLG